MRQFNETVRRVEISSMVPIRRWRIRMQYNMRKARAEPNAISIGFDHGIGRSPIPIAGGYWSRAVLLLRRSEIFDD